MQTKKTLNINRLRGELIHVSAGETALFRRQLAYPHHKHAGSVDNVIESTAPDLASVLKEIEPLIPLS